MIQLTLEYSNKKFCVVIGQQQVPKSHNDLLSYLQATKTYSEPANSW